MAQLAVRNHSESEGVWLVLAKKGTVESNVAQLRRRSRRSDLLRLDRWATRATRQRNIPETIHTSQRPEPLVAAERDHCREVACLGPNASIGYGGDPEGEGGRPVGDGLRRASQRRGSSGSGEGPEGQPSGASDVRNADERESLRHSVSDRKRKEGRDSSQTHRHNSWRCWLGARPSTRKCNGRLVDFFVGFAALTHCRIRHPADRGPRPTATACGMRARRSGRVLPFRNAPATDFGRRVLPGTCALCAGAAPSGGGWRWPLALVGVALSLVAQAVVETTEQPPVVLGGLAP